jgi:hypothetical protein
MGAKKRPVIAIDKVTTAFDDAKMAELAKIAKLPPDADKTAFAEGVREAAHRSRRARLGDARSFRCDRTRPFARIDRQGLLWLVGGGSLVELRPDKAIIEKPTGACQSFPPPSPSAWRSGIAMEAPMMDGWRMFAERWADTLPRRWARNGATFGAIFHKRQDRTLIRGATLATLRELTTVPGCGGRVGDASSGGVRLKTEPDI